MAKKIFRIHNTGETNKSGWFVSDKITSEDLKTIKTSGKEVATSIPTPFASIDLVKSAFKWVAENGVHGDTAQHKLVSDALDVAQLFFSYPKNKEKVKIVSWKPALRFSAMEEEGTPNHRKFSSTLKLFWEQDSVADGEVLYNFEKTQKLYFLLNKANNKVIGATSPATLFFASPDVRSASNGLNITIGSDVLFDNDLASLDEREWAFIEYMFALSKQNRFSRLFPEVYEYLEAVKENKLTGEQKQKLTEVDADSINNYNDCCVLDNENDYCEVLGIRLKVQRIDTSNIKQDSDFLIKADFEADTQMPLVLPQFPFSEKLTYTVNGVVWDENTRIEYKNTASAQESRLPVQNDPYYWLTIGNFFEDKIMKLPYEIDSAKFMTCGAKQHLIPLSETFFKYFKAENIEQYLTLSERTGGNVDAELKIPVRNGNIIFRKQYSKAENNVLDLKVHCAIFPFLKSNTLSLNHKLGVIDERIDKSVDIKVKSLKAGKDGKLSSGSVRNPGIGGESKSIYFSTTEQPDTFGLTLNSDSGYFVPKFKECLGGGSEIKFAIDFGTTNTHIEYKIGGNESKAFDLTMENSLWQSLLRRDVENLEEGLKDSEFLFEQEILPLAFRKESNVSFPVRTAIVYNKGLSFQDSVELIEHINNYPLLESSIEPPHLELSTQLKWNNSINSIEERKVSAYIEFLASMVFYKTLQLDCNPATANVTWFYPVSMDEGEIDKFKKIWNEVYRKVFQQESTTNIKGIPESIAPYLHYKNTINGLSLSIDIGGGSTDIAVFDEGDNKAKLISSFKFAGNSIFGDGYPSDINSKNADRNGFVKLFKEEALKLNLDDNQAKVLKSILDDTKNSSDFSSLLFSIEQNEKNNFSYTRLLEKEGYLKLSFLVFYGAIAYYSARLLKKSKIKIPKYILLSGTAAKTASILDSSDNLRHVSSLFQFIFEKVYGESNDKSLMVTLSPIPKEITCKGALKTTISDSLTESPVKFWIGGTQDDVWGDALERDSSEDIRRTPTIGDLKGEESIQYELEASIKDYYTMMDDYVESIKLRSKFQIDDEAYPVFKSLRSEGINDFLIRGIDSFYVTERSKIEETLFFYPLIGILNKLSYELATNKPSHVQN